MKTGIVCIIFLLLAAAPVFAGNDADEPVFSYDAHGMRDPFLPQVTSAGGVINLETDLDASEMVLEGVISDGAGRIAMINGNIIDQGKTIGLYTVQRIEADRVILMKDGQEAVLQLKKEE